MRPFRSFLLLLLFLICFAGLSYFLPGDLNLPDAETLLPRELIRSLFPADSLIAGGSFESNRNELSEVSRNTLPKFSEDTLLDFYGDTLSPAFPDSTTVADSILEPSAIIQPVP
jgi:hypothetical protein